jgi:hypothetical protein
MHVIHCRTENKMRKYPNVDRPITHTHTHTPVILLHNPLSLNTREGFRFGNVKVSVVGAGSPPKVCRERHCSLNYGLTDTNIH